MKKACYSSALDDALALAASSFRHIYRKGSETPYLTHLLQVMVWVGEHGGDEEQMIAAVLHDYLEDIPGATPEEVEARFGPRVRSFVVGMSDALDAENKGSWESRKTSYVAHLRTAPGDLKLICAADKTHNATCLCRDYRLLGDQLWDRFSAKKTQTLWYYGAIYEALSEGWEHPILEKLRTKVLELHELCDREPPDSLRA